MHTEIRIMGKKKVLFVSQEIYPYLPETQMSLIGRHLPQQIQEDGKDIRIFMPILYKYDKTLTKYAKI